MSFGAKQKVAGNAPCGNPMTAAWRACCLSIHDAESACTFGEAIPGCLKRKGGAHRPRRAAFNLSGRPEAGRLAPPGVKFN
jgi:hypothetical protein